MFENNTNLFKNILLFLHDSDDQLSLTLWSGLLLCVCRVSWASGLESRIQGLVV